MRKIEYIVGDVRNQPFDGTRIIPHCCNDIQKMGSGVAKALFQKWPEVRIDYMKQPKLKLGQCFMVKVEKNTWVANMIGQHGIKPYITSLGDNKKPPIRYIALAIAMKRVAKWIKEQHLQHPIIHAPKFGSDLAGGKWEFIEKLVEEAWLNICPVKICVVDKKQLPV